MAPSYRDHNISTYLPDTLLGGKKGNKANTKKQVLIQKNHRELRNKWKKKNLQSAGELFPEWK